MLLRVSFWLLLTPSIFANDQDPVFSASLAPAPTISPTNTNADPPERQPSIYYTTSLSGVSAYLPETTQVEKIVDSTETFHGIAYDSINNKLYWSSSYKIYKSNKDGSEVETVFSTSGYNVINGLAFDWIGGNIYAVTLLGYILACGIGASGTFSCYPVLDGQGGVVGIALDPTKDQCIGRNMLWVQNTELEWMVPTPSQFLTP